MLTADQKAKVVALFTEEEMNMPKPSAWTQVDHQKMRANMEKLHKKQTGKLKKILTAKQFAKYEQMQEGMQNMETEKKVFDHN